MKKLFLLAAAALLIQVVAINHANAQDFKSGLTIKSKDVEKSRDGNNPNIISKAPTSDNMVIPGPAAKGGTDKGDCGCEITFDNYTSWYVDIYFDGAYQGTLGAWQKEIITSNSGKKKIYMVTTGGSKEWTVDSGTCKGKYDWKISK